MKIENLDKLFEYFSHHDNIFKKIKLAVLMNKPENTVLPILAKKEHPQYKIEAFCTFDAAKKWVLE